MVQLVTCLPCHSTCLSCCHPFLQPHTALVSRGWWCDHFETHALAEHTRDETEGELKRGRARSRALQIGSRGTEEEVTDTQCGPCELRRAVTPQDGGFDSTCHCHCTPYNSDISVLDCNHTDVFFHRLSMDSTVSMYSIVCAA